MLTCKDFLKELSDYLDEAVDAEVRAKLEKHITECPNCWVITDTTKKTVKIYKGMEPYHIPGDVESRLMKALERKIADKARSTVAMIDDAAIPRTIPEYQHVLDTYASETNKTSATWSVFAAGDLDYRPHARSSTVREILRHQLLSERRFFGEFLGAPEPVPGAVLPAEDTVEALRLRLVELARPRLDFLATQRAAWWLEEVGFFDVRRPRIWVFWRRVLHSAHHRTQLTVYLRLLDKPVPSTYGPSADVTVNGADPTRTVDAAGRK